MPAEKHAFISYVKEDVNEVVGLQLALEASGIDVWRDKDQLWPGMDWKIEIRNAIRSGSFAFIACFSKNYALRTKSYQNEELIFAAEEYRLRPPGSQWLFPVRFDDVDLPEFDPGMGRTLSSLHYTDMFGSRAVVDFTRLATSVNNLLNPTATEGTAAPFLKASGNNLSRTMKTLLRDPNGDIALEEMVLEIAGDVKNQLLDQAKFPISRAPGNDQSMLDWVEQIQNTLAEYERVIEPMVEVLTLAGQYGLPTHEHIWTRAMTVVGVIGAEESGNSVLLALRKYPLVYLLDAVAVAATSRQNYGVVRAVTVDATVRIGRENVPLVVVANASNVEGEWRWIYSAIEHVRLGEADLTEEYAEQSRTGVAVRFLTPVSDRIASLLGKRFESAYGNQELFEEQFDVAEATLDAIAADQNNQNVRYLGSWVGVGRYTWRNRYSEEPPEAALAAELEAKGLGWKPIADGLFGGSKQRALEALVALSGVAASVRKNRS